MRTGTVVALHVGGLGNKIFNYGDTVKESNFPEGNFDRLIEGEFVRENKVETRKAETITELPITESDTVRNYKNKK